MRERRGGWRIEINNSHAAVNNPVRCPMPLIRRERIDSMACVIVRMRVRWCKFDEKFHVETQKR